MRKLWILIVALVVMDLHGVPIFATDPKSKPLAHQNFYDQSPTEKMVIEIQRSHIDGNVPAVKDFHKLLLRDLQNYFGSVYKTKVRTVYELLREGPTQSGVSLPKYYAWVKVYGNGAEVIDQGAVRVAAKDKTEFEVTDFWSVSKILREEQNLTLTFPKTVCALILNKASVASR